MKKTSTYSLKTIGMFFPPGSAHRLYLHGIWQLSRDKNPTMLPDGETNAWRAFAHAELECGVYIEEILELPYPRDASFWTETRVKAMLNYCDPDIVACA